MIHYTQINELITALVKALFEAEDQRLYRQELELVSENRKVSAEYYDGFFFQGHYYTDLDRKLASKGVKSGLHSSLVPSMEQHIKDKKEVEFDRLRIRQALALSLNGISNNQDLRDALPNQLAEMIDQIKALPRHRPEAYTLMDDPRKFQQYQKLREKIEFYAVARLLY